MRNLGLLIVLFVGISFTGVKAQKRTVAGVTFPAKATVNGKTLLYNGAGLREKYTFDLYVGALYLRRPSIDANKVINGDVEMGIHLELVSGKVTRAKFVESVKDGFKNASHGKATEAQINKFMAFFKREFKDGDKIDIDYIPGKGTVVTKNGTKIGLIQGLDFKKAIFSIWLGSKPADTTVKKGMLGKV
ncbi:MAG: chalcone isomerase family protein [Crocinitomicaceae bacterium]|nr:chalcone isomerase family protein [Crocinitomicaceae bacterium]